MNLKLDLKSLLKRKPKAEGSDDAPDSRGGDANQSMKSAAIWVKAHFLLVAMGVGSLSALGAGIYFSDELMAGLQEEARQFGGKLSELSALERTSVTITVPGNAPVTANTVVSRKLVEDVKSKMGAGIVDPGKVRAKAVTHNQGVHAPLVNLRVDEKDPKRQEIHLDLAARVVEAYDDLLTKRLGAGLPPSEEDITLKLQRRHVRFVQSDLKKAPDAALTDAERNQLVAELAAYRVALYAEAADGVRVYAAPEDIGALTPEFDPSGLKSDLVRLWNIQTRFWLVEDILLACASVNESPSVRANPIKRILKLQVLGAVAAVAAAGEGTAGSDADSSGESGDGDSGAAPAAADASSDASAVDPNQAVSVSNYGSSLKGWATNQLYDVQRCRVTMVVETQKIPLVADAFGKQNFIAITDVEISPTDAFAGLEEGCFYGEQPVSTVVFTLESAWLREWTGPLMPNEVRRRLKTTGQLAGAATADTSAGTAQEN